MNHLFITFFIIRSCSFLQHILKYVLEITKSILIYFHRYLKGGVKSGFHHVEDESVKRLLRVKGRRNVRLHEMPLEVGSLNAGDCFILDSSPNVFLYVGPQSGRMERIKAIQAANAIRDDVHHGRSTVKIIGKMRLLKKKTLF